jgi:hypothetical protein
MLDSSRMRTGLRWTLGWYLVAGLVSLPLAAVAMPSRGSPCGQVFPDPAWAAWLFRGVLWFSLAVFLPVSAGVTALLVWRTGRSARTCAAIGAGTGFVLVVVNVIWSMATAYCYVEIHRS